MGEWIVEDDEDGYVVMSTTPRTTLPVEGELWIGIDASGLISLPTLCDVEDVDELISMLQHLRDIAHQKNWGIG